MQAAEKNHGTRDLTTARRHIVSAAVTSALVTLLAGRAALAHEGDYYPDETIPEKARNIIEDSTSGGSTTLIYAGIGGLVAAGAAMYLANLARNRRTGNRTDTSSRGVENVPGGGAYDDASDSEASSSDASDGGSSD